ncbi:MAG: twin-arginine translocation signal domain-containing protein [Gemmatimonadetes bacterium]|nr:MAG: twin-arginine translocation signal domain-containing protein [Gemmatimonadota bacterium]
MAELPRRDFVKRAALGAAGAGLVSACGPTGYQAPADDTGAGPEVRWRLASSFPPSLDILHGAAVYVSERVAALTSGRFQIRVFAANEIVPALQVMDGVQAGTVQAGYTGDYYYIGKSPALAFGSSVPFGLDSRQQLAWLHYGGGLELLRGIYADFGIISFACGSTGAQFGGWFRRPIGGLDDLRGLRMRIPGLGGEIMSRLGVTVQVLGGADIYPALERGAIDATEWVGPYDDEKLGFWEIAPHYYMPGWWEPGLTATLQVGLDAWNALPPRYQEVLRSACAEANLMTLARYDAENPPALRRLVEERGVTLHRFPDDVLEAAWNASNDYFEEQAAADAAFREVYDSWKAFRARVFPYFAGNELAYANFAFPKL